MKLADLGRRKQEITAALNAHRAAARARASAVLAYLRGAAAEEKKANDALASTIGRILRAPDGGVFEDAYTATSGPIGELLTTARENLSGAGDVSDALNEVREWEREWKEHLGE